MRPFAIAEKFKAPQGEGLYSGTPMAFVRTVGCSVGQRVCTACDTDFDRLLPELGGGMYSSLDLVLWAHPYKHLCVTGGEPLDRDIRDLLFEAEDAGLQVHVETSGTVHPAWLGAAHGLGSHAIQDGDGHWQMMDLWVCVSPKPGWLPDMVERVADEVKVILGGLGDTRQGWPSLEDAVRWADAGKLVYVQPRNTRTHVDAEQMDCALQVVDKYPQLRLSAQLHKYLRTR